MAACSRSRCSSSRSAGRSPRPRRIPVVGRPGGGGRASCSRSGCISVLGGARRAAARSPRRWRSSCSRCRWRRCSTGSVCSRSCRASPRDRRGSSVMCWIIAAAVVALLNLDAAVVLLTPLYIRTARNTGLDPVMLAFQPVLLAMLASSALPISNLTNLIVAVASLAHEHRTSSGTCSCRRSSASASVGSRTARCSAPGRRSRRRGVAVDRRALATVESRSRCSSCCSSAVSTSACRRGSRRWPSCRALAARHAGRCRGGGYRPEPSFSRPRSRSVAGGVAAAACRTRSASAGDGGVRGFGTGVVGRERAQQPSGRAALVAPRRAPLACLAAAARAEPRSGARDHRFAGRPVVAGIGPRRGGARGCVVVLAASASSWACPRSRRSRCSCGCCEWRDRAMTSESSTNRIENPLAR